MRDDFKFLVKPVEDLTEDEKDQLMKISIAEYPLFEKYYKKNKYYSVIKPQMVGLVLLGDKIVGKGKFLWQNVLIGNNNTKMFGFGVLIDSAYQGQGLGTELIKTYVEKARVLGADFVLATTINTVVDEILPKLGFKKLTSVVEYTNAITGIRQLEKGRCYVLEMKEGLLKEIEVSKILYIGTGPV